MPKEKINPEDFGTPNHYAKLVWGQAQRDFGNRIIDLLPDSVDKR